MDNINKIFFFTLIFILSPNNNISQKLKFKTNKKENIQDNSISQDEMYKMSVNFNTPDWAKGKIMYHIFLYL